MSEIVEILREAPATSVEIAALTCRTVISVNASLQKLGAIGIVVNTHRKIQPMETHRGRYPYLWILA